MSTAEIDDFRTLIFAMTTAYGKEADELRYEGYWLALGDLPLKRIRPAVEAAMRDSKFLPTAAEIRELVLERQNREELDRRIAERQAQHAAAVSLDLVQGCRKLGWDDERITAELVRVGQEIGLALAWPEAMERVHISNAEGTKNERA